GGICFLGRDRAAELVHGAVLRNIHEVASAPRSGSPNSWKHCGTQESYAGDDQQRGGTADDLDDSRSVSRIEVASDEAGGENTRHHAAAREQDARLRVR